MLAGTQNIMTPPHPCDRHREGRDRFGASGGLLASSPFSVSAMASSSSGELFSEDQVAKESGLEGPLVAELIPRALSTDAGEEYSSDARAYDEVGLWRAKIAKILLDNNIRTNLVRLACRETLTVEQLRATVAEYAVADPGEASRSADHQ